MSGRDDTYRYDVSGEIALSLLGPPRIEREGRAVGVETRKALALAAYLAMARRPMGRDEVAALLWPESDHARARGSLRRTLSALGAALGGTGLIAAGDTLSLGEEIWVDVRAFKALASDGGIDTLREAVDLYGGDFLAGFGLRDSEAFDEWQLATADELRGELASALERLAEALEDRDVDAAIAYARRWARAEPLQEAAHRALIRLHVRKGDRAAAVRQYRECVDLLERELGVAPGAETTRLYEASASEQRASEAPDLQELVGDLLTLQGRYRDAARSYETALGAGASVARVRRKQADLAQRMGDYEDADHLCGEALRALDASDAAERSRILADQSLNAHRRGAAGEAAALAERALGDAEAAGDTAALAQAHNIAGILASRRGDAAEARIHLERSLELAADDPAATLAALNNLALALRGTDIEGALRLAQRALDLCARVGDRHREAAMHSNLADLLRLAGRTEEARAHLRTSAAIFAEVGEPDELHPEIWKLVEW